MPDGATVIYVYDGSYEGMLCCVFYSFLRKEIPSGVQTDDNTLLPVFRVPTEPDKADRVAGGIRKKLGRAAMENVRAMFLSCHEAKERAVIAYVHTGFCYGRRFYRMLDEDSVLTVNRAVKYLYNEVHRYKEFIRFSDLGGALVSTIEPQNMVLPLLGRHFVARFPNEKFMIYDKAHGMALVYLDRKSAIIPVDELTLPEPDAEELKFRKLWKLFYDTIEIKERHNERCRMNFMPKRFWRNMTEFADLYASDAPRLSAGDAQNEEELIRLPPGDGE